MPTYNVKKGAVTIYLPEVKIGYKLEKSDPKLTKASQRGALGKILLGNGLSIEHFDPGWITVIVLGDQVTRNFKDLTLNLGAIIAYALHQLEQAFSQVAASPA